MTYKFTPAVEDPDHWVNQYIEYAKSCIDSPWEYHEALAFVLLSLATPRIRLMLPFVPRGMATNLYVLLHGTSFYMRKSSAKDLAAEVARRVFDNAVVPENFTPGGLEDELWRRDGQPAVLFSDEFSGILDKMEHQSYMSGLRSMLLTLYSGNPWEYVKKSKGAGKNKERDIQVISKPHLSIAGCVTSRISAMFREDDIIDGFLPRFAIIAPEKKPTRKRMSEMDKAYSEELKHKVSDRLAVIYGKAKEAGQHHAHIERTALSLLDDYQEELENKNVPEMISVMNGRLSTMSIKFAMLCAAGRRDGFPGGHLVVIDEDALNAINMCRKLSGWSELFANSLNTSAIDYNVNLVKSYLEHNANGGESRRRIGRTVMRKLSSREMDELQNTLIDRNIIFLEKRKKSEDSKKTALYWVLNKNLDDEPILIPDNMPLPPE